MNSWNNRNQDGALGYLPSLPGKVDCEKPYGSLRKVCTAYLFAILLVIAVPLALLWFKGYVNPNDRQENQNYEQAHPGWKR